MENIEKLLWFDGKNALVGGLTSGLGISRGPAHSVFAPVAPAPPSARRAKPDRHGAKAAVLNRFHVFTGDARDSAVQLRLGHGSSFSTKRGLSARDDLSRS